MNTYTSLADALDAELKTDNLKKLATLICPQVPTKKGDRIKAIVTVLVNTPEVVFAQLSQPAQHAVAETVHTWDGVFNYSMFRAKYSISPWTREQDAAPHCREGNDLLELFLIANHIPNDLLNILRKFVPAPPEEKLSYTEDGPGEQYTIRETSLAALENIATILALTAEKKIRVSATTGRPTAATITTISTLLCDGDWYEDNNPMQAFAWPLLLQGGGLVKKDGSSLELNKAGLKALNTDRAGGIKAVWNKWEKSTLIDEFSRVKAIKGQQSSGGRTMTSPAKRRPMINSLLKSLEPGKWIAVDELSRLAQSQADYAFSMTNLDWKLYFLDSHYGHLDYHDTWSLLQLRYLLIYLFEYCATLGLLDVAYEDPRSARADYRHCWGTDELDFLSHCDGLHYVRINALGAYVLGHTDTFELPAETWVDYAFDGRDILVPGDGVIPPGQVLYLENIAKRQESRRWRISASSLMRAINTGENLAEIRKTLTASSATAVSAELELLFREIEQRTNAFVEVGRSSLIECSAELRKHILANKHINLLCMPAGDRYLAIIPGKEKQFSAALTALGFAFAVSQE